MFSFFQFAEIAFLVLIGLLGLCGNSSWKQRRCTLLEVWRPEGQSILLSSSQGAGWAGTLRRLWRQKLFPSLSSLSWPRHCLASVPSLQFQSTPPPAPFHGHITFSPGTSTSCIPLRGLFWLAITQDSLPKSRALPQSRLQSSCCHIKQHVQVPGIRTWAYVGCHYSAYHSTSSENWVDILTLFRAFSFFFF